MFILIDFKLTCIATTEEYKLLTKMNLATKDKYSIMNSHASQIATEMTVLQEKCILIKILKNNY